MRCRVVPLRAKGLILKRSQLPEPVEGRLVVSDWAPPWSKRWTRKAEFLERRWSMETDAFQPIFDVSLAKVDETGLYLVGHEMGKDESTGQPMEHVQVWWCQPLQPSHWQPAGTSGSEPSPPNV